MSRISKVLVIDDDLAVRLRVGDLLAQAGGYSLHEAADGREGLQAATQIQPDLILLDIMMPGMSGFEVCSALRADSRTRELPIIVLSAAEESEAMIQALDTGADDFLRKPFSAAELRAKVRTITKLNRFRALAAERDRLRWLFDHSLEPMLIADAKGALVYANDRAREIFGLPTGGAIDVATAIGRHFRAEPADAWAAWRELRLPPGKPFAIFQPETEQVEARWYEVELHALDSEGSQTLLKFTNRTGNVRRELETFTFQHLIAHKIRTPLNGLSPIFSFLAASETAEMDDGTRDLLSVARESADRLESTLLGILAYQAALFGGDRPARITPKTLAEVVEAAAKGANLLERLDLRAAPVWTARPERLEIVLSELLENYAKFSNAATRGLSISLRQNARRWELEVFAPGPGLPPDVVAQLGRPYAQLERRFSGEVPGLGLGLATIRILLRSSGGDIVFENHSELSGLVATLHLPLAMLHAAIDHTDGHHS